MNKTIHFNPVISEKSLQLTGLGQYTFAVPSSVNKHEIAQEIAQRFNVKVLQVRIAKRPAKPKKKLTNGKNMTKAKTKAIVRLAKGESIPGFQVASDKSQKKEK